MELWTGCKRQWRRLETAAPVRLVKRRIRQLFGIELRHFVQIRCPTEHYGGWSIAPAGLGKGSVVYSFGVGTDVDLDLSLIKRFDLEVHAFDPTPKAIDWISSQRLPPQFHFHSLGVADYDGTAEFSPPTDPAKTCYTMLKRATTDQPSIRGEVRRLSTIATMLGHSRIDLLKMDVEGAEYQVLDDLLDSNFEVHQLLVEFHHRFPEIGQAQTQRAVKKLSQAGFQIFSISPSGREYSFIRHGVVQPA